LPPFLFIQVGTAKIFALPDAIMPGGGTAPIGSLPGVAGVLETFGGGLLMAVAYSYAHAPQGFCRSSIKARTPPSTCFSGSTSPPRGRGPGASTHDAAPGRRDPGAAWEKEQ
jgi:putative oxidoreductase